MKLLVWIALIVLVISALRAQVSKAVKPRHQQNKQKNNAPVVVEPMLPCVHCGVHIPVSEALTESGMVFCSDEHRRLHFSS